MIRRVRAATAPVFMLLCGLAWSASTNEPAAGFTFGPHPRLKYVLDDVTARGGDVVAKRLVEEAEKIVAEPVSIPTEEGQWVFYYACPDHNATLQLKDGKHVCPRCGKVFDDERTRKAYATVLYDRVDQNALTLARAWQVSKREVFATEVVGILDHYARLYPGFQRHDRWGRRGILAVIGGKRFCQGLDEAVSIIKLAQAYDLIYDSPALTAETRTRIEKDLFEAVVESLYAFYLVADGRNNHMTWYNAGVATVGAALGRADLMERAIMGSKGLLYQLRTSVTAEGLWYEGTIAYHFYALQAIVETVRAAGACGVDLRNSQGLKQMFLAPLTLSYPDGQLPALNDGDRSSIKGYREFYAYAAQAWDDPAIRLFTANGDTGQLQSQVYQDAGLAYLRRGSGDKAITAILDFGQHGGHHGHPDKLNLMLYALGREVFFDPGRLTYSCPEYETWARQTVAHNTVVVGRETQAPQDGTCLSFTSTSRWSAVVGEANQVYPGVGQRRALVLADRFLADAFSVESGENHMLDWLLHASAELTVSTNVVKEKGPLYDRAGYQYLKDLQTAAAGGAFHADWKFQDGRFLRTWLFPGRDVAVITGTGIGYELDSRVPFLMLRMVASRGDFVAVHDATGDGSLRVERLPAKAPGDIRLRVRDGNEEWSVEWDAANAPARVNVGVRVP